MTEGGSTNTQEVYDLVEQRSREYEIRELNFDPNNSREFARKCELELGLNVNGFGQTCGRYNEPLREFINALSEGRMIHDGNGLLAWCATNMAIKTDARELQMPVKKRSKDKIDPLVAIIMGFAGAMFAEGAGPNYYTGGAPVSA